MADCHEGWEKHNRDQAVSANFPSIRRCRIGSARVGQSRFDLTTLPLPPPPTTDSRAHTIINGGQFLNHIIRGTYSDRNPLSQDEMKAWRLGTNPQLPLVLCFLRRSCYPQKTPLVPKPSGLRIIFVSFIKVLWFNEFKLREPPLLTKWSYKIHNLVSLVA